MEPGSNYVNQDPDLAPPVKISSHLPDLIDAYISIRAQRLQLDKEAAAIKVTEDDLNKVIIAKMREGGMTALGAVNGVVKLKEYAEPDPQDWDQIRDYIVEHDAWELVHKRITTSAVKERWDAGETIPGIGSKTLYKLTVSKT